MCVYRHNVVQQRVPVNKAMKLPDQQKTGAYLKADLLNHLCGAGNISKIWCACGQHEIQHTK